MEDHDSFNNWLNRQSRTTVIGVVIIIFLAMFGFHVLSDRIWPCKISEGCDPNEEPYSDPW
jgi:hypothetical protein